VIGDFVFEAQTVKPAICQIQMSLFAQTAFGADTLAVSHDQQANHQFRINRRTPNRAVEIGEVMAQIAQIAASINVAQEVICCDVIFTVERVKKSILSARQLSHHAANPPAGRCPNLAAVQARGLLFQQDRPFSAVVTMVCAGQVECKRLTIKDAMDWSVAMQMDGQVHALTHLRSNRIIFPRFLAIDTLS
jgi:hypothetical protein